MKNKRRKPAKKSSGGGRGGRPALEQSELRSIRIGVSVNPEEAKAIDEKAAVYHMRRAFFLRELGLGHRMRRPIPAINYRSHRMLGHMARTLNRLVILAEAGRLTGVRSEFARHIYDELQAVRRALLLGEGEDDSEDQQGA